jgi:hypothetical protein
MLDELGIDLVEDIDRESVEDCRILGGIEGGFEMLRSATDVAVVETFLPR